MKFGLPQQLKFGASFGTYSEVTSRESYDQQITATDDETSLLLSHFGEENIFRGKSRGSEGKSEKEFLLYPLGKKIILNLIFPKPEKQELRLYISKRAGFKPVAGSIWFLFLRDGALWIGSMSESEWRSENRILTLDDSDSVYQEAITEHSIRTHKQSARDIYARKPSVALKVIRASDYQCEFDSSHKTFIARSSNLPYMEAHHLIPMSAQKYHKKALDNMHNVFCLCATCHRAVHHSVQDSTRHIIDKLIYSRPKILEVFNVSKQDLYKLYSVETIE